MTLLGVWAHVAAQRPHPLAGESEEDGTVGLRGSAVSPSRARRTVAASLVGGLLLIGGLGAVQGANHGDAYDVLKGAMIGALAGGLLSLLLACAAITSLWGRARTPGDAGA